VVLEARAYKMSKSRGNVVNPDEVISEYGADSFRLYEMFMGPLEQVKPWSTRSVEGPHRFLNRVWRLIIDDEADALNETLQDTEPSKEQLRVLHQTIQKVTDDIDGMRFNTAIAAMMEFVNAANKWDVLPRAIAEQFVLILSPFAPHLAEELWQRLGHEESLAYAPWPAVNEDHLKEDTVEIAVQVNGKVRGSIAVAPDAEKETVLATAKQDENVARHLDGKTMRREIYVPGRIVNFVVGS
jgi:leucyl-tRNA synthetase